MFFTQMVWFESWILRSKEEISQRKTRGFYCFRNETLTTMDSYFWVDCVFIPIVLAIAVFHLLYALHASKVIYFNVAAFKSLFCEMENEPSSKTDLQFLIDQITYLFIFNTSLFMLFVSYHKTLGSPAVLNAVMLLTYILALPTAISLICGTYIMNYLKGDSASNSILYAGVFDIANFFGFFKRFLIQFVRYVLISIKIAIFNFFVGDCVRDIKMWDEIFYNVWTDWHILPIDFALCLRSKFLDIMHYLWELTNIFIIYYAQLGAFVIVLIWLLKALYASAWPIIKFIWYKHLRK